MAGIDPRPHTLRALVWMADARQRAGWGRAFAVVAHVRAAGFAARRVAPADVIPARYLPAELRPDPGREANRERVENDLAWEALGAGLRAGLRSP